MKDWLKEELGEEDLDKRMRFWGELESCSQRTDETIEEYIDRFKRCCMLVIASKK